MWCWRSTRWTWLISTRIFSTRSFPIIRSLSLRLNIPDITCIPLSALDGDNVVEKSDRTPWYEGPSLLDFLETVPIDQDRNFEDFRYPVQYVLRPNLDFRGFCGKVASGIVRKGDTVMALPSGKTSK